MAMDELAVGAVVQLSPMSVCSSICDSAETLWGISRASPCLPQQFDFGAESEDDSDAGSTCSSLASRWCRNAAPFKYNIIAAAPAKRCQEAQSHQAHGGNIPDAILVDIVQGSRALVPQLSVTAAGPRPAGMLPSHQNSSGHRITSQSRQYQHVQDLLQLAESLSLRSSCCDPKPADA